MDGLAAVKQDAVAGPLNYLAASSPKPVSYTYEPPPGVPWRSGVYEPRELVIANARPLIGRLSLDREGFELRREPTRVADFFDEEQLRRPLEELVEAERPVVERRGQPEAVLDECLLARAVALVHAADLRHGLVRLVDERDEVVREEVEQAVRAVAGLAAVEDARVVLDPVAQAELAQHLHVELRALA